MARKIASANNAMGRNAEDSNRYELSDEERFDVHKGIDAASYGEFAPDDEMEEFYRLRCKK